MFKPNANPSLNNAGLLHFLFKWWKPLAIVSLASVILAVIFSGPAFIKPKYQASVIFFPSKYANSISKPLLTPTSTRDILEFGEEEQAEQLLEILNSHEIRNRIMSKYNLKSHYGIDPNSPKADYFLNRIYDSNISFRRTELLSIKVEVMDTDPQMAADIANDIVALVDIVKSKVQKKVALEALKAVETAYNEKLAKMKEQEDSLSKLRQLGIYNYREQTRALARAMTTASGAQSSFLKKQMEILSRYGGAYVNLSEMLRLSRAELVILETQYEKARMDATQYVSSKFVVNPAVMDPYKDYPVRWLIVLISFLFTLATALIIILVIEYLNRNRVQETPEAQ
jgi:capsular polysaccharide biosynthesis protein